MAVRTTQAYGEVLTSGGESHRVSQVYAEALVSGGETHRVSQVYVEVLTSVADYVPPEGGGHRRLGIGILGMGV